MTPAKKSSSGSSFTSFRILGEKAQKLLAKARDIQKKQPEAQRMDSDGEASGAPEIIVHLSIHSIVKATFAILAILFGVLLFWRLMDTLIICALAVFVAMVIDPGVQFLRRLGVPRGVGILLHYFIALFLFVFLLVSLIPLLATQLIDMAGLLQGEVNTFLRHPEISFPFLSESVNANLTELIATALKNLSINEFADAMHQFGQNLSTAAQGSLQFAASVAGSLVNFFGNLVIILVLAFFFQLEKEKIGAWLRSFLPRQLRPYADDKSEAIQSKMAQWARGQLVLCLFIGVMVFIAMTILRMPYSLTLGILAGFTEFIPVIGPLIAAIPAVLIGFTQEGFLWAVVIAAVYYVIQWCENNLLVPLIMKRAVGLSPIAILLAMLVGVSFPNVIHPVLGIIISIPATTIIAIFIEDWRLRHPPKDRGVGERVS